MRLHDARPELGLGTSNLAPSTDKMFPRETEDLRQHGPVGGSRYRCETGKHVIELETDHAMFARDNSVREGRIEGRAEFQNQQGANSVRRSACPEQPEPFPLDARVSVGRSGGC